MTKGELLFSAINVNDCVTKSKFDNVYSCRHSLNDGDDWREARVGVRIRRCGQGGCAFALRGSGARVFIAECDPICTMQACMEGFQVAAIESVVSEIDIFVSSTGNFNIITLDHMKKMKNNAIVGNIGHFDNEIDMAGLEGLDIKPQKIVSSFHELMDHGRSDSVCPRQFVPFREWALLFLSGKVQS